MLRPSFVPAAARFRRLRDLTRYRADLVAARTAAEAARGKAARGPAAFPVSM